MREIWYKLLDQLWIFLESQIWNLILSSTSCSNAVFSTSSNQPKFWRALIMGPASSSLPQWRKNKVLTLWRLVRLIDWNCFKFTRILKITKQMLLVSMRSRRWLRDWPSVEYPLLKRPFTDFSQIYIFLALFNCRSLRISLFLLSYTV